MNKTNCKRFLLSLLTAALFLGGGSNDAKAQAVIFPQETQPGNASLSESGGTFTLSNELFSATFVKDGGVLRFGGCDAMNLLGNDDLFLVKLSGGDPVGSSQMTLGTVRTETLTGNAFAVRGVERFNGQQLVAEYTYDNLSIVWRAVLRDGSHYLRTELEITASGADVAMEEITPMLYTVNNATGTTPPVVVGNTRGAVIANNKIFAGLETPMGVQTSGAASDLDHFTKDGWTATDFAWRPSEIPSGMTGVTLANLAVKRGYLHFNTAGSQTITLTYASGTHKLNIKGVDLCDPLTGGVVASDYHAGSTGEAHSNNVYTLNVPAATNYMVRFFVDDVTETITSTGNITYSGGVANVEVVRDLVAGEEGTQQKALRMTPIALAPKAAAVPTMKLVTSVSGTADATVSTSSSANFSWGVSTTSTVGNTWPTYTNVPQAILNLQSSCTSKVNRVMTKTVTFESAGEVQALFTWSNVTGSNNKLNIFGVEIVDAMEEVIASDYHWGKAGSSLTNNAYKLLVPQGTFKMRFLVADVTVSGNTDNVRANAGNVAVSLTAITALTTSSTSDDTWTTADFVAVSSVPAGITALNSAYTTSNVKVKKHAFSNETAGQLQVEMRYTGGDGVSNRKLFTLGVAVVDANGQVISEHYGEGTTGDASTNNIYKVSVPAGVFTLCYYASTKDEPINSVGRMDFTLTTYTNVSVKTSIDEKNWTNADWQDPDDATVPAGITALTGTDSGNSYSITAARVRTMESQYNFLEKGEMVVEVLYKGGTSRTDVVGLALVDAEGNIISSDYHFGYTGSGTPSDNVYHVTVPAAGVYTLRTYCSLDKQSALSTSGQLRYFLQSDFANLDATNASASLAYNNTTSWWNPADAMVPLRVVEAGCTAANARVGIHNIHLTMPEEAGAKVQFNMNLTYASGNDRLDIYGVELWDLSTNSLVASNYHAGYAGNSNNANDYSFTIDGATGDYQVRIYTGNVTTSTGTMTASLNTTYTLHLYAESTTPIKGTWRRNTTLEQGKTWKVSHVVGLIAQSGETSDTKYTDQSRRSFLAYSERERAVPWRPFPCYISWYELNINRNNDQNYTNNMKVAQCENVVKQWKTNLFDKYDKKVKSFVWDDGWDFYGTWTFNKNFPNGFSEPDAVARKMGSSIGCWLGPVGGYGESGNYRRNYWSGKGGMQLSNPDYYNVFITACTNMINDYSFNFFKFDGISAQFSAVGPDLTDTGLENAEGIINIEREIRALKPDIFLNTTVGTWASPFWFQFTDAVWRQENDYDKVGNQGTDREQWITYRDNLVHQNFVTNSPLCPINTLMTHGFILSQYGGAKNMDYAGVVRELRCAFACGSGMVELYNDYELTNSLSDATHSAGSLWKEIADCIDWQERNADVLPDVHWVGGDPWTGSKSEVYGWAAWNGRKATLALRNGQAAEQTFTTTLRRALEIPAHITGSLTLKASFSDQAALSGLTTGTPINIDAELTLTFPASSVYVFEGAVEGFAESDPTAANMQSLLQEAKAVLEKQGIGFPEVGNDPTEGSQARQDLSAAITAASQSASKPTEADIAALQTAINAYKSSVTEITQPGDGHAYALTTTIDGTQYYLDYSETEGLQLVKRTIGTAIPASATFVCHNIDGKTLYVNDAGKYIALGSTGYNTSDNYTAAANLLQAEKTATDFGALRLGSTSSATRKMWMKASPRLVGESPTVESSTAFTFREVEYANLVTLREPTNADGHAYASICLPFNYIVPSGVTAYRATMLDETSGEVTLKPLSGAVPAGEAVVLVSGNTISSARLAPAGSETLATILTGDNLFKGVTQSGIARNTSTTTYVLNGDRSTGNIGFFRYTGTNLPAYRAYLEVPISETRGYLFRFDDVTTGVPAVDAQAAGNAAPIYDLSGRRCDRAVKGIYIRDGKKIYVK